MWPQLVISFFVFVHHFTSSARSVRKQQALRIWRWQKTHISCHGTCISACMFFFFRITASCHILAISVSTVLVYAFSLRPGAAFVDIFCYATRYVSHCGCVDLCRISNTVLVLVTLLWLPWVALELPFAYVHHCYHWRAVRLCRPLSV